jgi:hypothetical protein
VVALIEPKKSAIVEQFIDGKTMYLIAMDVDINNIQKA